MKIYKQNETPNEMIVLRRRRMMAHASTIL